MKKYMFALILLSVLQGNYRCMAQTSDSAAVVKILLKCWRAIGHEYSTIYGLEEEEIKNLSKQKLCFTKDSVTLYYGATYAPKYSVKKVNAENFAKNNFDCNKVKLGMLADSVYEITISSVSKPGKTGTTHKMTDVIAFDGDCIYVVNDGVIFKLFDSEAKKEARGAN